MLRGSTPGGGPTKMSLVRAWLIAVSVYCCSAPAFAAWVQEVVDAGGIPGANIAISSATSKAYIPILREKAIAVFDGVAPPSRMELAIKPTNVGYSAATGRLFVAGGFDNAVVAIDEATGMQSSPIGVGIFPDTIIVDDARGKVFVSNWGGIEQRGSLSIIDSSTLSVRTVALDAAVVEMALDRETGVVFLALEHRSTGAALFAMDTGGNIVARANVAFRAYSLAVDSRNGRVYVGGLATDPLAGVIGHRILWVFAQPGLQLVNRVAWSTDPDRMPLVFMLDPARPGLYFGRWESDTLMRVDADGNNLQAWPLSLGSRVLEDGRTVVNGVLGLNADPRSGRIFISSSRMFAEFDPATAATTVVQFPEAVGFNAVHFWPDSNRILVTDAADEHHFTLLRREGPALNSSAQVRSRALGNSLAPRGIQRRNR